jgi:hypothetical protein
MALCLFVEIVFSPKEFFKKTHASANQLLAKIVQIL